MCRDLKSSNVLLSADGRTAKVADVGAAAMMDAEYVSRNFGTLAWAAPELLAAHRSSQLTEKVSL
jgi:serine/threonine protein kinase